MLKLNKQILPIKCLYFFVKLQIFSFYYFRGPFLLQLFNIQKSQYGKIMGTILSFSFFSNIIIAYINDRFRKSRMILITLLCLSTVCFECFFFLGRGQFVLVWTVMFFYLIFETGVTPLLDHHCVSLLAELNKANEYGRQRLWGAVAFSISNFLVEWLFSREGKMEFGGLRWYVPMMAGPAVVVVWLVVRDGEKVCDVGEGLEGNKEDLKGNTKESVNLKGKAVEKDLKGNTVGLKGNTIHYDLKGNTVDMQKANTVDSLNLKANTLDSLNLKQNTVDSLNLKANTKNIQKANENNHQNAIKTVSQQPTPNSTKKSTSSHDTSPFNNLYALISNKEFLFFIFIILLNGITRTSLSLDLGIYQLEILDLKNRAIETHNMPFFLKGIFKLINNSLISITTMCGTLVEVLFLFLSVNIVKKYGLYFPLLVAQIAQFLRNLGYCLLPFDSKHVFIVSCLLETCKGINFALTHTCGVQIANTIAPIGSKTLGQMVYGGVFFSLASFISGQSFGRIFERTLTDGSVENKRKCFKVFFSANLSVNMVFLCLFVLKYGVFDGRLGVFGRRRGVNE